MEEKWNLNILKRSKTFFVISLLILIFGQSTITAQGDSISFKEGVQQANIDRFANLYLLTNNFEFKKYNEKGQFQESYSDLELSEESKISSDHPFKSMLFYPEYDLIRVLGNKLQVIAELNLTQYGFGEVTAAAPSIGYQSFWIFDATNQQLVKINQQYAVEFKSDELTNYTKTPFFPKIIKEREGWVYAYDPDFGFFIFDSFGTFSTQIEIDGANSFSVFNQKLYLSKQGELFEIEPNLKIIKPISIAIEGEILDLSFRKMVVEKDNTLRIVKF